MATRSKEPKCPNELPSPCTFCDTDRLLLCPQVRPFVKQYCRSNDILAWFDVCGHWGGTCACCRPEMRRLCRAAIAPIARTREQIDQDLDDMLQDFLCRAFERKLRWEPGKGPPEPWLRKILRNRAISIGQSPRRKRTRNLGLTPDRRANASVDEVDDTWGADPFDVVAHRQETERLRCLVKRLPLPERQVVTLRFWEGHTLKEIAQALDKPISTVYAILKRALGDLGPGGVVAAKTGGPNND